MNHYLDRQVGEIQILDNAICKSHLILTSTATWWTINTSAGYSFRLLCFGFNVMHYNAMSWSDVNIPGNSGKVNDDVDDTSVPIISECNGDWAGTWDEGRDQVWPRIMLRPGGRVSISFKFITMIAMLAILGAAHSPSGQIWGQYFTRGCQIKTGEHPDDFICNLLSSRCGLVMPR